MSNLKDIQKSNRIAKASYDFTVVGGAVATITLPNADIIPNGAIITKVMVDMKTALTSGGSATVVINGGGITIAGATPAAYGSAPFNGTVPAVIGQSTGLTVTAPYIPQVATSSAPITLTVGTAALTAGKFDIYIDYTI
jgi:hypothetical protein